MADGQRVTGIYRHSVMLASGRFTMFDDGRGFSMVHWNPAVEQRLGRQITATMRPHAATWDVRTRSLSR